MIQGLNLQSHSINTNNQQKINTITLEKYHKDTLISSLSFYKSIFQQYQHSNYYPFFAKNNSSYEKDSKSVCDFKTEFSHSTSAILIIQKLFIEKESTNQIYEENQNDLIQLIIKARKQSAIRISSFLKRQLISIRIKRDCILKSILNTRLKLIMKIQATFRRYFVYKQIKVFSTFDYILFYTLKENKEDLLSKGTNQLSLSVMKTKYDKDDLKLYIYGDHGKKKERDFIYSKLLKKYYIPFMKRGVIKQKYKVNFVLNGHIVVDSRYNIWNDTKGNFYNIISKSLLYKVGHKKRVKEETLFHRKYMDLFKMKSYKKHSNSWDSLSISNASITNDQFNDFIPNCSLDLSMNTIKPILKKANENQIESLTKRRSAKIIHKVSFNHKVEYSY